MLVELISLQESLVIGWGHQTNRDEPVLNNYKGPIKLKKTSKLLAVAHLNGKNSFFEEAEFVKIPTGRSVKIKYPYNQQYTAGGDLALVNTIRGAGEPAWIFVDELWME